MSFLILLVVFFVLTPYCLALVMPNWRWLGGCFCLVTTLAAVCWLRVNEFINSHPDNDGADLDLIALDFLFAVFAAGCIARAVTLRMRKSCKPRSRRIAVNIAGLPLFLGLWSAPSLVQGWNQRGPSEACAAVTSFKVDIAGGHFAIPNAELFNIYLDTMPGKEDYYLWSPSHVRRFCDRTFLGARGVTAKSIWMRFGELSGSKFRKTGLCQTINPEWSRELCLSLNSSERWDPAQSDWPSDAYVFAMIDGKAPSGFGASASSYDKAKATPQTYDKHYDVISTTWTTPDGKPFAAQCYTSSDARELCETSFPWRDGMHLQFRFSVKKRDDIDATAQRIDTKLEKFLGGLL
jgi:hypothetical protein